MRARVLSDGWWIFRLVVRSGRFDGFDSLLSSADCTYILLPSQRHRSSQASVLSRVPHVMGAVCALLGWRTFHCSLLVLRVVNFL